MKYMAEDGKVFETMTACKHYEENLISREVTPCEAMEDVKKNVILYNSNGEKISYDDFENLNFDILTDYVADNCFFIKVLHNLTAGEEFVNFPTGAGTYRWNPNDDYDEWIDIDDDIEIFMENWKNLFPNLHITKGE